MIGNDIVDLAKAKEESNIFRPRYLEKICNAEEIELVLSHLKPIDTFWRIWTMKESAYKAFQRKFNFKTFFNPLVFRCEFVDPELGNVVFNNHQLSTKTIQTPEFVYTEVVGFQSKQRFFGNTSDLLMKLKTELNLKSLPEFTTSLEGLPVLNLLQKTLPISKTHHGNFQVFQY